MTATDRRVLTPERRVAELARDRRIALLCFERDESRCHRQVVAELVLAHAPQVDHTPLWTRRRVCATWLPSIATPPAAR